MADGLPTVTGFTETFLMATGFLLACLVAALLVPKPGLAQAGAEVELSEAAVVAAERA